MKIWQFTARGLLRGVSAAVLAGAVVLGLGLPAKASLLGDQFNLNSNVVGGPFDDLLITVIDPGAEFTRLDGTNVGDGFFGLPQLAGKNPSIDVGASSITFFFDFGHQATYTFTNLNWTDMPGTITGVSSTIEFGTLPGLTNPTLFFTADSVTVGVDCTFLGSGIDCDAPGGTQFRVDITAVHIPEIPEPSTVTLAALALLTLLAHGRRRRV